VSIFSARRPGGAIIHPGGGRVKLIQAGGGRQALIQIIKPIHEFGLVAMTMKSLPGECPNRYRGLSLYWRRDELMDFV
jgi:hypothetical protein